MRRGEAKRAPPCLASQTDWAAITASGRGRSCVAILPRGHDHRPCGHLLSGTWPRPTGAWPRHLPGSAAATRRGPIAAIRSPGRGHPLAGRSPQPPWPRPSSHSRRGHMLVRPRPSTPVAVAIRSSRRGHGAFSERPSRGHDRVSGRGQPRAHRGHRLGRSPTEGHCGRSAVVATTVSAEPARPRGHRHDPVAIRWPTDGHAVATAGPGRWPWPPECGQQGVAMAGLWPRPAEHGQPAWPWPRVAVANSAWPHLLGT